MNIWLIVLIIFLSLLILSTVSIGIYVGTKPPTTSQTSQTSSQPRSTQPRSSQPTTTQPTTTPRVPFRRSTTVALNPVLDWTCIPNVLTPIKITGDKQVSCASNDGVNCLWQTDVAACNIEAANGRANVTSYIPLQCQQSNYDDPNHWCAISQAFYRQNSGI